MDPISDLLIRIKNSQKAGLETLEMPFSKIKFAVAKILAQEGFISGVERKGSKVKERLEVILKYEQGVPAIQDLKRVSKPGQRHYIKTEKIKAIKQGYGTAIISTSQGLMTDKEAKKKRLGGEVLCEIW